MFKSIMFNVFNYEKGVVNHVLNFLGFESFDLYNTPNAWPIVLIFLKLWKQTGYGSVVYLAAITGLDQEMFEAASIDGASAWQKIRYITIPSLVPTMVIMVLLAIGNIFRGDFGMFYQTVKSSALLQPVTGVIDTYVFGLLINNGDIGVSAAAGLYQSVLCFITITICNKLVKKADGVWAEFGTNAIKVPDAKVRKLVDESYIGKEVVMGIRPENIHDEERFLSVADGNLVEAKVEVTELMGSETYLYLQTTGKEGNVVARVDPRSTARNGDTIKVAFETSRLHFFDKDTEKSILNR